MNIERVKDAKVEIERTLKLMNALIKEKEKDPHVCQSIISGSLYHQSMLTTRALARMRNSW